jgi:ectoine hydroxylase-related dioxygenase (phytanoyl-CoA dioxygenase family)
MGGSARLFGEFFSEPRKMNFDDPEKPPPEFDDLFLSRPEQLKWYEDRGRKLVKVCADPGDVIIWDSRTMHYACFPGGDEVRTIIYACYTPAAFGTKEDLEREGTTHWPHRNIRPHGKAMINGKVDPKERDQPLELPEQTKRIRQLAAVEAY